MKMSKLFVQTLREFPSDAEVVSHKFLVKAGYIRKLSSGIYNFLPLMWRVLKKVENIVREEMNSIGSQELVMPQLLPEEVYIASGRRENFGSSMFALRDRFDRSYVLGPTHEEMFVEVAKEVIKSHKDMPISLYQMANKYRDEPRSRYGLIRTREFIMKDAYTFDKDLDGLGKSYNLMFNAYKKIFDRIGLDYRIVKASTGAMGGLLSEEFQAVCDIGEDVLVLCDNCGLSTNIEICECKSSNNSNSIEKKSYELIETPSSKSIEDVCDYLKCDIKNTVKTLIYKADGKLYAVLVRGDRVVNETKLSILLNVADVELSSLEEDMAVTHAEVGFAGPIGLEIPVIVDLEVNDMVNYIAGANKTGYHYLNVNNSDFEAYLVADIRNVCEDDKCPVCGSKLSFKKGIEVGNTFKLGDKYCKSLNLQFTDIDNTLKYPVMGCYGIGVARILSAFIEQNHDDKGIIFNDVLTPYDVELIIINSNDEQQKLLADKIYSDLKAKNIDVLYDDRDLRPGVKFGDADLIGIPKRIVVGRDAVNGQVELKSRITGDSKVISVSDLYNEI